MGRVDVRRPHHAHHHHPDRGCRVRRLPPDRHLAPLHSLSGPTRTLLPPAERPAGDVASGAFRTRTPNTTAARWRLRGVVVVAVAGLEAAAIAAPPALAVA